MARYVFSNGNYMVGVPSSQRCPICGAKDGRCSIYFSSSNEVIYYACRNVFSTDGVTANNLYKHFANKTNFNDLEQIRKIREKSVSEEEITPEILAIRDKVYRRMRELVKYYEGTYLYDEDMTNLLDRGLTKEQIEYMGFFSVPSATKMVWRKGNSYKCKLQTAIAQDLYDEFGNELMLVAGFKKIERKKGDFITYNSVFKNSQTGEFEPIKGYFIPYHNNDGLLVAMQYRLTVPVYDDKGKLLRYFWFSSESASSGSPVDYYKPMNSKTFTNRDGEKIKIVLVTEGALKGKIACEYFGCEGIFMAGVGTVNSVVKTIQELEDSTGIRHYVISALDMDKYENYFITEKDGKEVKTYPILRAESKLISSLKAIGNQVAIMEWNDFKGVDEAMVGRVKRLWKTI